jgi:hypothetical protein
MNLIQGIPEDSNETRGIVMNPGSLQIKRKNKTILLMKILIQVNSLVCLLNLETKSIEVAKFGTSYISIIGEGHGTEAVSSGFNDLNLHRIKAGCAGRKYSFYEVLEKVGMIKRGTREDSCYR